MAFIPCPKLGNGVGRDYWLNLHGRSQGAGHRAESRVIAAWCADGQAATTCGDLEEVQQGGPNPSASSVNPSGGPQQHPGYRLQERVAPAR